MIDKEKHIRGMVEMLNGAKVLDRRALGAYLEAHIMPRGEKGAVLIGTDFMIKMKNHLEEYADTFVPNEGVDYTIMAKDRIAVLCKYHEEKTPSCSVDFGTKEFHCFGCGASGKVIMRGYTEFDLEREDDNDE